MPCEILLPLAENTLYNKGNYISVKTKSNGYVIGVME
jgi:hypothetical protein